MKLSICLALSALCLSQVAIRVNASSALESVTYRVYNDEDEVCSRFTLAGQIVVPYFSRSGVSLSAQINLPEGPLNASDTVGKASTENSECPKYHPATQTWTSKLNVIWGMAEFSLLLAGSGNSSRYSGPATWSISGLNMSYSETESRHFTNSNGTDVRVFTLEVNSSALGLDEPIQGTPFVCDEAGQMTLVEINDVDPANRTLLFSFMDVYLDPFNATAIAPTKCSKPTAASTSSRQIKREYSAVDPNDSEDMHNASGAQAGQMPSSASATLLLAFLLTAYVFGPN